MAKIKVQMVMIGEDCQEITRDVACMERDELTPETLGVSLTEGKNILKSIQEVFVEWQMNAHLRGQIPCPRCKKTRQNNRSHPTTFRTVFGTISVNSPRLCHCECLPHPTKTFSPLANLLPEHTTPELLFLETKWAALMSYGLTAALLQDVLPIDEKLNAVTIRNHLFEVAERLEHTLGDEKVSFIEGAPREWGNQPIPDGPITVGIDGGYIRSQRKQGMFEAIAGKSICAFKRDDNEAGPLSKCFAFVQTYDDKPKRRLFELLKSQGMQENQRIEFLSDGGDTVRDLQLYLNPQAEHYLDWFHVTMRLTVLMQMARGLPQELKNGENLLRDDVLKSLESVKWYLWHGNVSKALQYIDFIAMDLEGDEYEIGEERIRKLYKTLGEFQTYIILNQNFIPNYGERYRQGERISTGFTESAINQVICKRMTKKQQMQWSLRGAHLLLQVRTRVLNGDWEAAFRTWYPGFRYHNIPAAA